jgi:hypothetical protein
MGDVYEENSVPVKPTEKHVKLTKKDGSPYKKQKVEP